MTEVKEGALLGLDLGTSYMKGSILDVAGNELVSLEFENIYDRPAPGWVELEADQYLQAVFGLIRNLTDAVDVPVTAMAFSGASGNTLLCDDDGRPLTPIINWMDQRASQDRPAGLDCFDLQEVRTVTGWPCIDQFPLGHLAWLRESCPDLYKSAGRYAMNTDWLLFQLTGKWFMDYSTATTFHLQDQRRFEYYPAFVKCLGIEPSKLSTLCRSGFPVGVVMSEVARMTGLSEDAMIVTGCFDHPSAARAEGILKPGRLMLSCGTSWVGFFPEYDREKIIGAGLLCDPFLTNTNGPWGAMFSVPYIGKTIDAYVNEFIAPGESNPLAVFDALAASSESGGIQIDLREPVHEVDGTPAMIARAVMEGAARLLNEQLGHLRSFGFVFEEAVMAGGASHSPIWPQIIENMTGLKLRKGTAHSGARGAAILAGIGAGIYRDEHDAYVKTGGTDLNGA